MTAADPNAPEELADNPADSGADSASDPPPYVTAPPPGWKPPRAYVAAVALLVAAGFALGALTLVLAGRIGDDSTDDVRETSGAFATALLTYDYGKLDEAKARVLSFATGGFKKQYEQAMAGGLDVLLRETQAQSRVTNLDVFVADIEDDTASAIAVLDTVAEGKSGTRRTLATYIRLELVRVGGGWKIDAVTNLNFGQTQGPVVPGGATTTAPARASR